MLDVYSYNGKGSKKLNRSGLMKNRYQIVSMDIQKWKLNEFKKEQEKLSSYNIETKIVTLSKSYKRIKGKVDKILIDLLYSGSITIKKNHIFLNQLKMIFI